MMKINNLLRDEDDDGTDIQRTERWEEAVLVQVIHQLIETFVNDVECAGFVVLSLADEIFGISVKREYIELYLAGILHQDQDLTGASSHSGRSSSTGSGGSRWTTSSTASPATGWLLVSSGG